MVLLDTFTVKFSISKLVRFHINYELLIHSQTEIYIQPLTFNHLLLNYLPLALDSASVF